MNRFSLLVRRGVAWRMLSVSLLAGMFCGLGCRQSDDATGLAADEMTKKFAQQNLAALNGLEGELSSLQDTCRQMSGNLAAMSTMVEELSAEVSRLQADHRRLLQLQPEPGDEVSAEKEFPGWLTVLLIVVALVALLFFWKIKANRDLEAAMQLSSDREKDAPSSKDAAASATEAVEPAGPDKAEADDS